MPLKKCSQDKKSGWKWGDSGKCYTGPEGKRQAIKQGVAIEGPEKFSQKVKAGELEITCLLYTSPSPRDRTRSRMPSSA